MKRKEILKEVKKHTWDVKKLISKITGEAI